MKVLATHSRMTETRGLLTASSSWWPSAAPHETTNKSWACRCHRPCLGKSLLLVAWPNSPMPPFVFCSLRKKINIYGVSSMVWNEHLEPTRPARPKDASLRCLWEMPSSAGALLLTLHHCTWSASLLSTRSRTSLSMEPSFVFSGHGILVPQIPVTCTAYSVPLLLKLIWCLLCRRFWA